MTNLLKETVDDLKSAGKQPTDIQWIGDGRYITDWNTFEKIADIEYDSGFGAQEIATTLKIVGVDWWMERHEYDGSEWWEFKTIPQKEEKTLPIIRVYKNEGMWESLEDMNK